MDDPVEPDEGGEAPCYAHLIDPDADEAEPSDGSGPVQGEADR